MRYVGYSEFFHDAGLAIIENGEVTFASQSERYTKVKNDPRLANRLWDMVNNKDHITFYEDQQLKWDHRGDLRFFGAPAKNVNELNQKPVPNAVPFDRKELHHISHCAAAYYTRPWTDTKNIVQVSIDGSGEIQTAVILDSDFNLIKEYHIPKSVGLIYTNVTKYLGLRPLEDEYVVMGLASYGKDQFSSELLDVYNTYSDIAEELQIKKELSETARFKSWKTWCDNKLEDLVKEHSPADVAASVQEFARVAIIDIMKEARKYGSDLVYSGGCAQNVVINSEIYNMFDRVHIAIAPNDGGSALGCAARSYGLDTGETQVKWTPYLGYDINKDVNPREVAEYLVKNQYCGLANGRAEYGPRALGNRSLIADVRHDVKDTVNAIKRRQKYRPFAPAILEEFAKDYFEGPMNEYMQYACKALHDYSSVTHVDGTARVQLVRKDCPSIFRKVIEEFYDLTGVPMLLNTSLNIRGRPIVNDEKDAKLFSNKYKVKVF